MSIYLTNSQFRLTKQCIEEIKDVCYPQQVTDKAEIVKCVTFCCFGEKLVTVGEDNGITIWEVN
jgi:hypothetical protein